MIAGGTILAALLAIGLLKVEGQEAPKAPVQVQPKTAAEFHEKVEPILSTYCYECHGGGEKKGEVQLDERRPADRRCPMLVESAEKRPVARHAAGGFRSTNRGGGADAGQLD